MDSSSNHQPHPSPSLLRRFSTQSTRTLESSSNLSHSSNPPPPIPPLPSKYRSLQQQSRSSKPPISGLTRPMSPPAHLDVNNNTSTGGARPVFSRGHSSQRSFTGSAADLTTNFIGSVKRSLSLSKDKKDRDQRPFNYYGMTPEEDAARVYGLGAHKPLLAAPTFQQIASGVAVQASSRGRPSSRQSSHSQSQPQPKRSSIKRASIQSINKTPNSSATGSPSLSPIFPSSKAFTSSVPSLPQQQQQVPPAHVHVRQLMHAATVASSSTASFSTSSASGSGSNSNSSALASPPPPPPNGKGAKHKLSLSIAALTGRMRVATLMRPGTANSGSVDSGVPSATAMDGSQTSPRKAVRFTDLNDEGDDDTSVISRAASPPGVWSPTTKADRPAPVLFPKVPLQRVGSDTIVSTLSPPYTPQGATGAQQTGSFGQRTARFFSR